MRTQWFRTAGALAVMGAWTLGALPVVRAWTLGAFVIGALPVAGALPVPGATVTLLAAPVVFASRLQNPPISTAPVGRRASPPQPQQRQGPEYLAGTWSLEWTGRESPITPGPRTGTVTFARNGNVLTMTGEGKTDAGAAYKEAGTFTWDESNKTLAIKERLTSGAEVQGVGDWSSPLSIRFESEPMQVQDQTLKVRRTYSILSAISFSVAEELSTNGGPYQRLGNGQYLKK